MAVKDWDDGDFVSGDEFDDIQTSVVMRFADTTARDAALVGDLAPVAGMLIHVAGVGYQQHNGTTWITVIAANQDTGWTAASLGTGFANYGSGYENAGYRRMADGSVRTRGLVVTNASTGAGATIFTLPTGYRPGNTLLYIAYSNHVAGAVGTPPATGTHRVNFLSSGAVTLNAAEATIGTFVSLEGISFMPSGV